MTESERQHFEVVLEQILHEVRTVAEGHGALDQKIERYHKEAREDHRTVMDLLKFSHAELDKKIDGVRVELKEEMAAGFKSVGSKVDGHEERIQLLERKAA